MAKKKDETTTDSSTETSGEVGTSDVNFTTADGTGKGPASSSDGTATSSSDSTTSPSPSKGGADPLASGASEPSSGAPDASNSDTDSASAKSTAGDSDITFGVVPSSSTGATDKTGDTGAKESLKGASADGEGATHIGTDTPEKLISNPYNEDTGEALFKEDTRSKEPLNFDSFKEKPKGDAS